MVAFYMEINENRTKKQRDFAKLGSVLDIMNCRGQGYDGASKL